MSENLEKIRPALVALEVGESVSFPISRLKSVRTQASELGAIYNRQFKTRTDRENHTITVKRTIPYETFLNDLSSRIVRQLKADKDDPEFISQRKAYELFGRRNVERWKRQGKVVSYKRPGKVEYRTADLRLLQRTTQDYFDESQSKQTERPVKKDK